MPSDRMLALLGLLAVAGYQNRDKIKQVIANVTQGNLGSATGLNQSNAPQPASVPQPASGGGLGGLLGGLLGGGGNPASQVHGGLMDLINHLTDGGQGQAAQSWVQNGPNKELSAGELEQALGSETLSALTQRTGLNKDDLLNRLKSVLPTAVDQLTPQGRLPPQTEAGNWLNQVVGQTA
jgi:uncharacterized protein YidB (DUF937 family)